MANAELIAYFEQIDPDEPKYLYEANPDSLGLPEEIAKEIKDTKFLIGQHDIGGPVLLSKRAEEGPPTSVQALQSVSIEIGKVIIALERDGKYSAADFFMSWAAKRASTTTKSLFHFGDEGRITDPNTGKELSAQQRWDDLIMQLGPQFISE